MLDFNCCVTDQFYAGNKQHLVFPFQMIYILCLLWMIHNFMIIEKQVTTNNVNTFFMGPFYAQNTLS